MADKTITSLTELAEVPSANDIIPIWDTSESSTKKITPGNLLARSASTWTPVPTNLTINGGGTPTYVGAYTRDGNIVHCYLRITVAGGTSTCSAGSTKFTLPFAPARDSISNAVDMAVFYGSMNGVVSASNNAVYPGVWVGAADILVTFWYTAA